MFIHFFNIGGQELIFIFLIVLLLFGAKKIPELARGLGKGMRDFKKATEDINEEVTKDKNEIDKTFND